MIIHWERIAPVIVSILVIIAIAILREYSKVFASIAAVMPINVPLGMWIVSAGEDNPKEALATFSEALLVNIIPTIVFLVVAWQMTKAGYGLIPTVIIGYAIWGVGVLIIFALRGQFS
ncbi:hypothetical protein G4Y79_02720 [Phototrophicus methaneseepsis]|uniref:DUF3147 family protein n=1 Tax=Phototrophicus methaneseepsis TaxID=2710758 RepID=A0A7S8IFU7_9CHLR|nr:hypothetical protein [Phototrophicus methaneseepsis]QPC83308.1 hypothetical protein G4Y79_02720 [Phototrophicus methaneseepsis]